MPTDDKQKRLKAKGIAAQHGADMPTQRMTEELLMAAINLIYAQLHCFGGEDGGLCQECKIEATRFLRMFAFVDTENGNVVHVRDKIQDVAEGRG